MYVAFVDLHVCMFLPKRSPLLKTKQVKLTFDIFFLTKIFSKTSTPELYDVFEGQRHKWCAEDDFTGKIAGSMLLVIGRLYFIVEND